MTNKDFVVLHVNPAFTQMFRASDAEIVGKVLFAAMGGRWNTAEIRKHLEELRFPGGDFTNIEAEIAIPGTGQRRLSFRGRRIEQEEDGSSYLLVLTIMEIT